MTRFIAAAVSAIALIGTATASGASGPVFALVPAAPPVLPSAEVPNAPGSVAVPISFTASACEAGPNVKLSWLIAV